MLRPGRPAARRRPVNGLPTRTAQPPLPVVSIGGGAGAAFRRVSSAARGGWGGMSHTSNAHNPSPAPAPSRARVSIQVAS